MLTRSPSAPAPRRPAPGRRRRFLLFAHELRRLLRLAGPIVVSQLGGIGMATMDTIMVAPLGATALAGVGLAVSIYMVAQIVALGVLLGMAPLVSQAFGAGDREQCRRVLVQGLWLALLLSIPVIAVCLGGEAIARRLGQEPVLAVGAGSYLRALASGVLPALLFISCRQFLEGMGRTQPAMVITFVGLAVNYFGNRALIYGIEGWAPALGATGSGWATTLVQIAMLLATIVYFGWSPALHPLRGIRWRPERRLLGRITGLGAPTGLQLGMEIGFFSGCAVMMGWFGPLELATHQITINLAATTFMVALGVSLAGSIRVGHAIGAAAPAGARRAAAATYLLSVGSMSVFALLFLLAPEALLRLYTSDAEMLRLGVVLLGFAAAFQLFDGAQVAGVSVLRGVADTRVPTGITTVAYLAVGIPAAYLLGFHSPLGPAGVWAGMLAALATAALLLGWRVRLLLWSVPVSAV